MNVYRYFFSFNEGIVIQEGYLRETADWCQVMMALDEWNFDFYLFRAFILWATL